MQVLIATGDPEKPFEAVEVGAAIESLAHWSYKFNKRLEVMEKAMNESKQDAPAKAETPNEEQTTIQMDFAEAVSRLGSAMVGLAREQDLMRQTLQKILDERAEIVDLVTALNAKVDVLTKLHDHHQATLERAGLASPRPKGSTDVN